MDPKRRREADLDEQGKTHDCEAKDEDHEHGGAIANVVSAESKPARRAALNDRQIAIE